MKALQKRVPELLRYQPIAVIMGGDSLEHDFSLRSGKHIESALKQLGLNTTALQYDEQLQGLLDSLKINLCVLATHGVPGEDGKLQGYLESIGRHYSGASVAGSALAMNKLVAKTMLQSHGIKTPKFMWIDPQRSLETTAASIAKTLGFPVVLKPTFGGSSIGVRLVKDLIELRTSLEDLSGQYHHLFAEKFIEGRELTVSVLEDFKGRAYTLPIMELESANLFYDYESKWSGQSMNFVVPAKLEESLESALKEKTKLIHQVLMQRDHSRSDFILGEDGEIYYLETNSIPGLTENSDLPAQAKASGMTFEEVVLSILMGPYRRAGYAS